MSAAHESAEGLFHLPHLHTHPITRNCVWVPTWARFKQTLKCAKSQRETAEKHVDRGDKKHAQRSTDTQTVGEFTFQLHTTVTFVQATEVSGTPDADVDDEACAEEREEKEDRELKNTSVAKCRERQTRDLFPKAHILAKKKKKSWVKQAFSILVIKVLFHSGLNEYRCCSCACWLSRITPADWREVHLYTFDCLHLYPLATFIHSIYSIKPTFLVKHFQKITGFISCIHPGRSL